MVAYQNFCHGRKPRSSNTAGNTGGLPSDLTGIVHAVIQKIHTCGASGSSASTLQLKTRLPAFCTVHRSVIRALSSGSANCCLIADCLYLSSSSSSSAAGKRQLNVNVSADKIETYVSQSSWLTLVD